MAELKVKITADVAAATAGMSAVEQRTKQLEVNIAKLQSVIGNTTSVQKLTSALNALKQQQIELNRVSQFTKDKQGQLAGVTNQATFAMGNFARVVQDAPYGIRGVANNIDPLIESFTRLRLQTGSAGGAFKAMLTTLAGPTGILLAVSTVTSLLVAFGDKIFSAKKDVDELNISLLNLNDSFDGIDNVLKNFKDELDFNTELGKLNQQVAGVSNSTIDLNEAQSKVGNSAKYINLLNYYIGSLEEGYKNTTKEANDFLDAVRSVGQAATGIELQDIQAGRLDIGKPNTDIVKAANKELVALYENFQLTGKINLEFTKNLSKEDQKRFALMAANAEKYTDLVELRTSALRDSALAQAQLNDLINRQEFEAYEKGIEIRKKQYEEFKKLDLRNRKSIFESINLFKPAESDSTFRDTLNNIKKIQEAYLDLTKKRELRLDVINRNIIVTLTPQLKTTELPKSFETDLNKIKKKITDSLSPDAKKNQEALQEVQEKYKEYTNNIINIIDDLKVEGISTIGAAIGEALVTGDMNNSFMSFANVLASGLEAIGKELIKIGLLSETVQVALKNLFTPIGGPTAIAAGIGLIAAATALRASLSQGVGARALGGPVSGATPYLVGEKGPEIFVPRNSGTIIPNNRLNEYNDDNELSLLNLGNITARALGGIVNFGNKYLVGERGSELFVPSVSGNILPNYSVGSFMSGRMSDIGGKNSVLRGQDIILAYARTQRSQLRVNG